MNDKKSYSFTPAVTERASEVIFKQIRESIIRGELKPGDRLPSERKMMDMFSRSRPTVREALRMLERAGFIRTEAGKSGAVITEPSSELLKNELSAFFTFTEIPKSELLEYRAEHEQIAAEWAACRRTDEDIRKMKDTLETMKQETLSAAEFVNLDIRLHHIIAEASHNAAVLIINDALHQIIQGVYLGNINIKNADDQQQMFSEMTASHERIVQAIIDMDSETAKKEMSEHVVTKYF